MKTPKNQSYKTYNALMKHICNSGIEIQGSIHKQKLQNVGYYHGYKGYKFFKTSDNKLNLENFDQLTSIIEFDEELKAILYGPLMKLETALKSQVCNIIVTNVQSSSFSDIFEKGICKQKQKQTDKEKAYRARDTVYACMTKRYKSSAIIQHFYNADRIIPLWAILEEFMLGDLSQLVL